MTKLISIVDTNKELSTSSRHAVIDLPSDTSYRNAFYYPQIPGVTNMYLFGSGNKTS